MHRLPSRTLSPLSGELGLPFRLGNNGRDRRNECNGCKERTVDDLGLPFRADAVLFHNGAQLAVLFQVHDGLLGLGFRVQGSGFRV